MNLFGKRRPALERIANQPVTLEVGTRQKQTLTLREPSIFELTGFIEGAVSDLVPVYADKMAQVDRIVAQGNVGIVDFGLFKPALVPICDFIALLADRDDLKGKLHEEMTPAQFVEGLNTLFYLLDIGRLWGNFTDVLARVDEAKKQARTKKPSSARSGR